MKRHNIPAERQEFVRIKKEYYALDFAIYCAEGKIDVETDGDIWHVGREQAERDNLRNNDLEAAGWQVLRFNTSQVKEETETYCVPTIVETINRLGGVDDGGILPRQINLNPPGGAYQLQSQNL